MHLNQGELYVYSPDGAIQGMDTIQVETGRFAYEISCDKPGTLILVFPNFSEQPIFAESGGTVEVKADASHLKEMQVKGTDDNKLMTQFREMIAQVSPPEETRLAMQFIKDHPASRVSVYLLHKYFLRSATANYKDGIGLADVMLKEQPDNGQLVNMRRMLQKRATSAKGQPLPAFTATDTNGQRVNYATLRAADTGVVIVWAAWNFQSLEMLRNTQNAMSQNPDIKVLGISVDARVKDCKNQMKMNNITFPVVCDGQMLESPLLQQLGLATVPAVLVLKKGKIVERNPNVNNLRTLLEK